MTYKPFYPTTAGQRGQPRARPPLRLRLDHRDALQGAAPARLPHQGRLGGAVRPRARQARRTQPGRDPRGRQGKRFRQPELGGLMNCSHWSTKSDQFSKPYLDLPSFFIKFAMFVTSFAGSVSASERDQQNTKLTQKILSKNRAKQYKKFHVVLTTFL